MEVKDLTKVEGLSNWQADFLDSAADPCDSIVISDRAIVIANRVFVLESG